MKYFVLLLVLVALGAGFTMAQDNSLTQTPPPRGIAEDNPEIDNGEECQTSGCTIGDDSTQDISDKKIKELLVQLALEPYNEESEALDILLFHHKATNAYIQKNGSHLESSPWQGLFEDEVAKTHIKISVRVTDDNGISRITVNEKVAIGGKYHLHHHDIIEGEDLVVSGRSKRVGLNHIWVRF